MVMSFNPDRRHQMIEMLLDDDLRSFNDGSDTLWMILREGFKGYENFTDDELTAEMNERDLWTEWFTIED